MTTPVAPGTRTSASRAVPIVVLVLVLVVSGLLVWRTVRDGRPAAADGTVLEAGDPIEGGKRFVVRVPGQAYNVTVRVREDVPDDVTVRKFQAPDGGRFVGVSLTRSAEESRAVPMFAPTSTDVKPSATVVVDGRQHRLSKDGDSTAGIVLSAYWMATAGGARSVRLEFTWGGRSQSLDLRTGAREAGDFAPLYRNATAEPAEASCGPSVWTAGYRTDVGLPAGCRFAAERIPYVSGEGWAPKGSQWLVLRATTSPSAGFVQRVGSRDVRYYSQSTFFPSGDERPKHRLDGRAPLDSFRFGLFVNDGSRSDSMLFRVPTDSSRHTATFVQRVQGFGRSIDSVVEVSQTWTVRL